MAHWSSGYADFHDELYAEPSTPLEPPILHCTDCDATFVELAELRQHVFEAHPTAHPALMLRGLLHDQVTDSVTQPERLVWS